MPMSEEVVKQPAVDLEMTKSAQKNKKNKQRQKRKKQAAKKFGYQINQGSAVDMEGLMVLTEEAKEEIVRMAKYPEPVIAVQVKTTKIDYHRTEKATATHRFAPEVVLTVKSEETKETQSRAVTCYDCSLG